MPKRGTLKVKHYSAKEAHCTPIGDKTYGYHALLKKNKKQGDLIDTIVTFNALEKAGEPMRQRMADKLQGLTQAKVARDTLNYKSKPSYLTCLKLD